MFNKHFLSKLVLPNFAIIFYVIFLILMVARMAVPMLSIPYYAVSFVFILYVVIYTKSKLQTLKSTFRYYFLFYFTFIIYCIVFILHPFSSNLIISDLANGFLLIVSCLAMNVFMSKRLYFRYFIIKLTKYTFFVGVVIALCGLVKYILYMYGFKFNLFYVNNNYIKGSSLVNDYNYFSYFLLLSCLSWFFIIDRKRKISKVKMKLYLRGFIFLQLAIIGSASRRGFVVLLLFYALILLLTFKNYINKKKTHLVKSFIISICIFLISFFSLSVIPANTKVQLIQALGMNFNNVSKSSCKIIYRYTMIYRGPHNFYDYYEETWGRKWENNDSFDLIVNADEMTASRKERIRFSLNLYNSSSLKNKFLGSGFEYLNLFGENFSTDIKKLDYDYPHNIFLSALLYSGLIGLFFIVLLFFQVCWNIVKLKKMRFFMIILFSISLFFNFFSGNSLFSIPIFGISLLLPLHTYWLQKSKS